MAINDKSEVQTNDNTTPAAKADAGNTATPPKQKGRKNVEAPEPSDADKYRAASQVVIDAIPQEVQEEIGPLGRLLAVHNARTPQDPTHLGDFSKAPGRIASDSMRAMQSVANTVRGWLPFGDDDSSPAKA